MTVSASENMSRRCYDKVEIFIYSCESWSAVPVLLATAAIFSAAIFLVL